MRGKTLGDSILDLLAEREMTGYEIVRALEERHQVRFRGREGVIYPALAQLVRAGWIGRRTAASPAGVRTVYHLPVLADVAAPPPEDAA